jgi:hypothetical protein
MLVERPTGLALYQCFAGSQCSSFKVLFAERTARHSLYCQRAALSGSARRRSFYTGHAEFYPRHTKWLTVAEG